jgi:poly(hydroxyalkanoate) depolymerase family esterase
MDAGSTRLKKLENIGANPGNLLGWHYVPGTDHVSAPVALVVVLHGCTQTAAGYDVGSGWSKLADEFGFAVLFPEQSRQNNPNLCFNWFSDSDIERDHGEVRSIREMIGAMISGHSIDPKRVFNTGLSAGGAMANAMLAAYPEVFAGGAVIAGLPYGVASSIPDADSDEAAPLFRDDCAPGFRDDLAPCLLGSAGDDCCHFIQATCQALRGRFRRRLSPLNSMRWAL